MLENITKKIVTGLAALATTGVLMGGKCSNGTDDSCNSMNYRSSALKTDYASQEKKGTTLRNLDKELGYYESALSADGCRDGCYKTGESKDYTCCWCDD
ncbi:hypothetical protein J4232_01985 [Candidatus Woesearchaeota archaeon]|nr:hypothetical protein [Candidatus Woesearchaeota archaeon]